MEKYDIFISYRRKETADKAEHMFTLLEHAGYEGRVSFDRENLDGRFDLEILRRLDECNDFIVVLAQDTLSDLKYEDVGWYHKLANCTVDEFAGIESDMKAAGSCLDFVRLEIARAIAKKKHIIPVVPIKTVDYSFDELNLPDDISLLIKEHAERYQDSRDFLFKDILPRIIKRLKSRPNKSRWLKYLIAVSVSVIVIVCLCALMKWNREKDVFRNCRTQSDYEECARDLYFFRTQCKDSIDCFKSLKNSTVPINDACNTGNKDFIRVKWGEDCSLQQLRVLRPLINNMMYVEKGTFIMGADEPLGLEDFKHKVTIDEDFYIGKFEITEREWHTIMSDSASGNPRLPVTDVSWNDCQQFVRKLQTMTDLLFILPTEEQWEYAATRNGDEDWIYAGSGTPEEVANFKETSSGNIEEVDLRKPNGLELYNMSGNVSEWCQDGAGNRKRIRGGSFLSSREEIAVSYSDAAYADGKSGSIGLRLTLKLSR